MPLEVSPLATTLRSLADSAKHRLWVACPYIGSWSAVKRILGSAWQKVDVRMLLDKDSGILARDTIEQFAAHRPVRSLKGLHAKLYIMDNSVLLTSANLTESAFTRRFEAGLVLEGNQAKRLRPPASASRAPRVGPWTNLPEMAGLPSYMIYRPFPKRPRRPRPAGMLTTHIFWKSISNLQLITCHAGSAIDPTNRSTWRLISFLITCSMKLPASPQEVTVTGHIGA
jgi:PLD-like domain